MQEFGWIECCVDCGKPVFSLYVVTDEIWLTVGYQANDLAHATCLAKRLGRNLTPEDFTDANCNDPIKAMRLYAD